MNSKLLEFQMLVYFQWANEDSQLADSHEVEVQYHKQHQVHNITHYTLTSSGLTHSENIQPVFYAKV